MKILTEETSEIKALFQKMAQFREKIKVIETHYKPIINGEIYLSGEDLCDLLHISKRTLQQYRDDNILPYVQLNGKIIYRESDVHHLLEKNYRIKKAIE